MHRVSSSLPFALLLLVSAAACKKEPPAEQAAPAAPSQVAAPVVEEGPIDALTPPPPPRPPDLAVPIRPDTLNGDPKGPKRADFDVVQGQLQAKVQACLDAMPAGTALPGGVVRLAVKYEVGSDGSAKDVAITGELPADALNCAKAAIGAAAYPKFSGSSIPNSFTLSYSRPQAPAPAPR